MRYLDVNKKWLSYLESLDLDNTTENYFILQSKCIYKLSNESKLDEFLMLLSETIQLKKGLSDGTYGYGSSFNDFRVSKKRLFDEYGFNYDKPLKEKTETTIIPKIIKAKEDLKELDLSKVKLKNSNVYVYTRFHNDNSISENFSKCIKKPNSESIDWKHLDKDLLCEVLMPILNEMLFFNEEEFWEFKKIQYYNKYLNRDTFLNHFNSWNEFENYIGVDRKNNENSYIIFKNRLLIINGALANKTNIEAIKRIHLLHNTNWMTETKAFICYASIPVLYQMKNLTISEESFTAYFNTYYNMNESEITKRSILNKNDIVKRFKSWSLFLKFIENGYFTI